MTHAFNYFGDWKKVISYSKLNQILTRLDPLYSQKTICPSKNLVFKAFSSCSYSDLKVVMLGQDPYPQKGVATGIAFGNNVSENCNSISPSLEKLKEAVIDYRVPHSLITFDHTLENWAKQGCLMLNSALTVEAGNPGSHTMMWRPFIASFLQKLSDINTGLIYVLFGKTAQTFSPYIGKFNYILKCDHPAYAVRTGTEYECDAFIKINEILKRNHGMEITWFKEY